MPIAAQHLLSYMTAIMKSQKVKKTAEYKKMAKEVEAVAAKIAKEKEAKEEDLCKLNGEIENLSVSLPTE